MTYQDLWHRLTPLYDDGEAQAIIRLVLEVQFGISLTDIYTGKVNELSRDEADGLEKIMSRLERAEPVQYVLGYAMFCGRPFHVASGVLIPRPETEVLCRWIEEDYNRSYCALQPPVPLQVLDVGTGSGCIAVSLALDLYNSALTAWDVSGDALLIARENIHRWDARVELKMEDALHPSPAAMEQQWDVIVSNPPYICNRERAAMAANVLEYEPETALFVPDDDPLQFYRAIAEYGVRTLSDEGVLYFEPNPLHINKVKEMLTGIWQGIGSLRKVRNIPLFLFYSLAIWGSYFLHYYLTFFCFDSTAHLGLSCALVSFVVGSIAVIVPTPNGAGPWHFAVKTMLILYGVADNQALYFVLIVHTIQTLLVVLLGVYAWIALSFTHTPVSLASPAELIRPVEE